MFSIKNNSKYLYEIKKSKFYVLLYRINSKNDISKYLDNAKVEYKDATHYCYAYKIGNIKKCSDDNEPSGTAGMPILEVLDKKNINNVLCIVVRYFGGIKLGAGGLIRAYSTSVKEAIDNNSIIELIDGYLIRVDTAYDNKKDIEYLFKDNIIDIKYLENIIYTLKIKKEDIDKLNKYRYEIIDETQIEKE